MTTMSPRRISSGSKPAPGRDVPFAGREPVEVDAVDARAPVAAAGHHLRAALHEGRRRHDAVDLAPDRLRVLVGQRRGRAGAEPRAALRDVAGRDDGEVRAERADLPVDEVARAGADRHHGDDGRDADDDAEHGEQAAQGIRHDGRKRGADGFGQAHAAASGARVARVERASGDDPRSRGRR